jgi:uncharacterized membrane protein YcaP (DUF421 family)
MDEVLRPLIGPDNGEAEIWQLCIRAVVLFVVGLAAIRVTGRRTFSQMTPLDIVVALVIGANLSRAMTGRAQFVGAIVVTLLIALLHRLAMMAAYRWPRLCAWMKPSAVVLVRDGVLDRAAAARYAITGADLAEGLRMEQVERIEDVRLATLEAGGKISVVPKRATRSG